MRSCATAAGFVVAALLVFAACGSSAPKAGPAADAGSGTHGWSKSGFAQLQAVRGQLRTAFPGACKNNFTYERADYISTNNQILKTLVPDAVGSCDIGTENLEISVFGSAKDRDTFITERVTRLCARAASKHIRMDGIPWITEDASAMQPDSAGGGQRIAAKLGGAVAKLRRCPAS